MKYQPLWMRNKIENEILVFAEEQGEVTANLAFDSPQDVEIFDRAGNRLRDGADYRIEGRKVYLLDLTRKYLREGWLQYKNLPTDLPTENEIYKIRGCTLFSAEYLRDMQYLANYRHNPARIKIYDKIRLLKTYDNLKNDGSLKIALFGDSISNAANSSWEMGKEGYRHWLEDAASFAERTYGANVQWENFSRSGFGTEWALTAVEEKFKNYRANLVIIAFGMNDGASGMGAADFARNVSDLMQKIRLLHDDTEFVLVATILPNPDCKDVYKTQEKYYAALCRLEGEGVCVLNFSALSEFLCNRKRYVEISGNNLNHPNDFTYAFYTDVFKGVFYDLASGCGVEGNN